MQFVRTHYVAFDIFHLKSPITVYFLKLPSPQSKKKSVELLKVQSVYYMAV